MKTAGPRSAVVNSRLGVKARRPTRQHLKGVLFPAAITAGNGVQDMITGKRVPKKAK